MKRVNVQTQQILESNEPPAKRKKTLESSIDGVAHESLQSNETLPFPIPLLWLDYDCLSQVLSYLSTVDLIRMCLASDQLQDAILNCDLRRRIFNMDELQCCYILKCFKIFGQHMTHIKISDCNIDWIMRLISTHCSTDTIKHLDIQYRQDSRLTKVTLHNVLPFFRQLESFALSETDGVGMEDCLDYFNISPKFNKSVNDFVERTLMQAANIKSIKLICVKVTGRFLHLPLENLQVLQFVRCNVQCSLAILPYLQTKPGLMQFSWIGSSVRGIDDYYTTSSDLIFNAVTDNLLDLKIFEFDENEIYISNSGRIKAHTNRNPLKVIRIQNLQNLQKLQKIGMQRCGTAYHFPDLLKTLKNCSIKELCLYPHLLYFNSEGFEGFRGYQKLDYYVQD